MDIKNPTRLELLELEGYGSKTATHSYLVPINLCYLHSGSGKLIISVLKLKADNAIY